MRANFGETRAVEPAGEMRNRMIAMIVTEEPVLMEQYDGVVKEVAARLAATEPKGLSVGACARLPKRREVIAILDDMMELMFPAYYRKEDCGARPREEIAEQVLAALCRQIDAAYSLVDTTRAEGTEEKTETKRDAHALASEILSLVPSIREKLEKDITALYEGDPAAKSPAEILLSYPGFYAIAVYRIAHEFYLRDIPFLSRMMTEHAHGKTGIDIHAGATVGEYFFIDHGTGIVIGETTVIGDHVKLYQGVTLGAKSFELDENGNPVKGIKRHPNIGNNVIIYANATILGGTTSIGDGAVIGGNVWITRSVEAGATVTYSENYRK